MSENEIKPVAWRWLDTCTFRKSIPKTATAGDWNPLYDQSAIDRLTAERDAAVDDAEWYRWLFQRIAAIDAARAEGGV